MAVSCSELCGCLKQQTIIRHISVKLENIIIIIMRRLPFIYYCVNMKMKMYVSLSWTSYTHIERALHAARCDRILVCRTHNTLAFHSGEEHLCMLELRGKWLDFGWMTREAQGKWRERKAYFHNFHRQVDSLLAKKGRSHPNYIHGRTVE